MARLLKWKMDKQNPEINVSFFSFGHFFYIFDLGRNESLWIDTEENLVSKFLHKL